MQPRWTSLYGVVGLGFVLYWLSLGRHITPSTSLFFLSLAGFFFCKYYLGFIDQKRWAEEERACAADPKRIFSCPTGLANSPKLKFAIGLSLVLAAVGLVWDSFTSALGGLASIWYLILVLCFATALIIVAVVIWLFV